MCTPRRARFLPKWIHDEFLFQGLSARGTRSSTLFPFPRRRRRRSHSRLRNYHPRPSFLIFSSVGGTCGRAECHKGASESERTGVRGGWNFSNRSQERGREATCVSSFITAGDTSLGATKAERERGGHASREISRIESSFRIVFTSDREGEGTALFIPRVAIRQLRANFNQTYFAHQRVHLRYTRRYFGGSSHASSVTRWLRRVGKTKRLSHGRSSRFHKYRLRVSVHLQSRVAAQHTHTHTHKHTYNRTNRKHTHRYLRARSRSPRAHVLAFA